ncbi:MAG TPA: ATP-binding cassette domain-containing protein [bacterium]|nr:ATP-binding cassette domain-containing protein [bacterium]
MKISNGVKEKNQQIDRVCGMDLTDIQDVVKSSHKGELFYFCGKECEDKFKKNPDKFQREPFIKIKNLHKSFKIGKIETKVLKGLNIHIWKGDFVVIIGSSGSGKSTLLNIMGLLDRPSSGQIFLNGKDISLLEDERRVELRSSTFGFVFQQYNLIPWFTAYENVILPLIFAGKEINKDKLENKFNEIGLKHRMEHHPFELSGGEQQRVALLRSLSNNPEIILGDEPTGNLDSVTGDKILEMLIDLNKSYKKTLVIVTHDADIAEKADQIIALKDGKLVKDHHSHKKIYTE